MNKTIPYIDLITSVKEQKRDLITGARDWLLGGENFEWEYYQDLKTMDWVLKRN